MKNWNKYLAIGVGIWILGKFVDTSQTFLIYGILFLGLVFVSYGLVIFFKEKKENKF